MPTAVFCFSVLFVAFFQLISAATGSHSTVEFLPGFQGPLPFELETGYVGVGDFEEVQLFYYFVKSEGNPQTDPLLFWLTGGPGCSALTALAFEVGPINFKLERYDGSLPQIILNPYSWTKKSNILFVDLPVGTGFSYGKTPQSLETGDFSQVRHSIQFLEKWLQVDHPEFISNPFYVGGDSYSGMVIPVIAQEILEENKHALPFVNLQGYILGNPVIRSTSQNFAIPYAHRMTLISDELFESLATSCKGDYVNIDPSNVDCLTHYDAYQKCVSNLEKANILLPKCSFRSPKQQEDAFDRRSLYNTPKLFLDPKPPLPSLDCPAYKFQLSFYWANDDQVRKALHICEGSIGEWTRCKDRGSYNFDIESAFPYHVNLSSKGYRSLIYRYTRTYANKMTFATIKGGGHTAEYTQKECSVVFSRWISGESL